MNVGVDALGCGVCGAKWGVGGLGDIGDSRVREEVGRRLAGTMSGRHKPGCGWRVAVCPGQSSFPRPLDAYFTGFRTARPRQRDLEV